MYGNLGGVALGAGALAATGSNLSTLFIVIAATAVALGSLIAWRERAARRLNLRGAESAE